MAMTTAPDTSKAATPPSRSLWQAPLFVLGAAALAAALFGKPLFPSNPLRTVERDLAHARSILAKPDGDADYALKLAKRALEAAEQVPEHKGEAAFLAGLASMKLAEKGPAARAPKRWKASRDYLELARQAGVPEDDRSRLLFRLGKAGLRTGAALPGVVADLKASAPNAEHRVEAYSLLAEACLRLVPPNVEEALEATAKLRELDETPEEVRTAARLRAGELLLRLGKDRAKEARDSLEKIGDRADPATLQRARMLVARSYQEEGDYGEAAKAYEVALASLPPAEMPQARFYLGVCYGYLGNADAAIKNWTECQATATGPEKLAASLKLADAYLGDPPDHAKAAEALARAAAVAQQEKQWTNPLLTHKQFLEVFERSLASLRSAGRNDLVFGLADSYARFAPRRQALALKADAAAALALSAKERDDLPKARELASIAGSMREQMADLEGLEPGEAGELLYKAALDHLAAGDSKRSAGALVRLVKAKGVRPERLGEAHYRLAEHFRDSGKKAEALEAFHKCMEYQSRWAYLARYRLAMADLEAGRLDAAEAGLVFNVQMLRFFHDPEAQALSLFALGNLLYQKREYTHVVRYLQDPVARLKEKSPFKDSPDLTRARFQLADSYRQIALRESKSLLMNESVSKENREYYEKQHKLRLRQAADEFAALDAYLSTPAGKSQLTRDQRVQVPFITAKCWFNLGGNENREKALKIYEKLIERYPDTVEGLDALAGAVSCHAVMFQEDKVKQRLVQVELLLQQPGIPADAKKAWGKWVNDATNQLQKQLKSKRPGAEEPPPAAKDPIILRQPG